MRRPSVHGGSDPLDAVLSKGVACLEAFRQVFKPACRDDYRLTLVARAQSFPHGERDVILTEDNCRGVVEAIARRMPGVDEVTAMSRVLEICRINAIPQDAGQDRQGRSYDKGRRSAWEQCATMLRLALADAQRSVPPVDPELAGGER